MTHTTTCDVKLVNEFLCVLGYDEMMENFLARETLSTKGRPINSSGIGHWHLLWNTDSLFYVFFFSFSFSLISFFSSSFFCKYFFPQNFLILWKLHENL